MTNAQILMTAMQEWQAGKAQDRSCWLDRMTEDVVFTSLAAGGAGLEFTVPRRGKAAVNAYIDGLTEGFTMNFFRADEVVAEGDRAVAFGATSWTNKDTGKSFETPYVLYARFQDGLIAELREYYDTAMIAGTKG